MSDQNCPFLSTTSMRATRSRASAKNNWTRRLDSVVVGIESKLICGSLTSLNISALPLPQPGPTAQQYALKRPAKLVKIAPITSQSARARRFKKYGVENLLSHLFASIYGEGGDAREI